MDEVHVKLDHGHRTMTETGGLGILSDQGWKNRRLTVKFLDEDGVHGTEGGLVDAGSAHCYDGYYHGVGGGEDALFEVAEDLWSMPDILAAETKILMSTDFACKFGGLIGNPVERESGKEGERGLPQELGEWLGVETEEMATKEGWEMTKGTTVGVAQPPWETALRVLTRGWKVGSARTQ